MISYEILFSVAVHHCLKQHRTWPQKINTAITAFGGKKFCFQYANWDAITEHFDSNFENTKGTVRLIE